jgi:hypothetical protein
MFRRDVCPPSRPTAGGRFNAIEAIKMTSAASEWLIQPSAACEWLIQHSAMPCLALHPSGSWDAWLHAGYGLVFLFLYKF